MTPLTPVIDADAHIAEPPDVFTSRIAAKFGDEVPRIVRNERGMDVWVMGDRPISLVATSVIAGWSDFPFSVPKHFEDAIPACFDPGARLSYMDGAGIWAQVLYPNVAGFGSQGFLSSDDEALKLLCVQAYNDFLHEWCSADPDRLIGVMALPFWDVEAAVREIERCAALGMRGALFTGEPQRFGFPVLGHRHWDPLYGALEAAGMPVHLHLGGGETEAVFAERGAGRLHERHQAHGAVGTAAFQMVELCLKNGIQCGDLITCGLLPRFPDLNFVSVETGIGWVPFMLEAADWSYLLASRPPGERYRAHLEDELLPSELFARQVFATYWFEYNAPTYLLDVLPVDNVMFETDFPHSSCLYGNIQETIERGLAKASAAVRRKFLWENAAKLYGIRNPPESWLTSLADR